MCHTTLNLPLFLDHTTLYYELIFLKSEKSHGSCDNISLSILAGVQSIHLLIVNQRCYSILLWHFVLLRASVDGYGGVLVGTWTSLLRGSSSSLGTALKGSEGAGGKVGR